MPPHFCPGSDSLRVGATSTPGYFCPGSFSGCQESHFTRLSRGLASQQLFTPPGASTRRCVSPLALFRPRNGPCLKQGKYRQTDNRTGDIVQAKSDSQAHPCGSRQSQRREDQDLAHFLYSERAGNHEYDEADQGRECLDREARLPIIRQVEPSEQQRHLQHAERKCELMRDDRARQVAGTSSVKARYMGVDGARRTFDF